MAVNSRGAHHVDTPSSGMEPARVWRLKIISTACLILAAALAPAGAQEIQGQVGSIGYPFGRSARSAVREGQWFPIRVELRATSGEQAGVEVELRAQSVDLDGDRVDFVKPDVTLTVGDIERPFWCYAVAYRGGPSMFEELRVPTELEIVDPARRMTLGTFSVPPVDVVENDAVLVLDVSAGQVAHLHSLSSPVDLGLEGWGEREFYRKFYFAPMMAANLPDRWFGLEMVNAVVWDLPDPRRQQVGASQVEALVEWVRNGGQLVVGVGGNADVLAETALADILPLELLGGSLTTSTLERFANQFATGDNSRNPFESPIAVAKVRTREGATQMLWDTAGGRPQPLMAVWNVGSGRVIASAASLRDLTGARVKREFYNMLFDLYPYTAQFKEAEASHYLSGFGRRSLFDGLVRPTDFAVTGQINAVIATFFVFAYIGLSTLASWFWLKHYRRTSWSWVVFAAFAVAASFLSLGAVWLGRGLVSEVHAASLVDLEAGAYEARAACWFGYRSPRRELLSFSLPTDRQGVLDTDKNYLRPLSTAGTSSAYATPLRYSADTERARLANAPLRATLKQFEGCWQGELDGTIRAKLVADRNSGRIEPVSWIANDLVDIDVTGGYLLYLDPRLGDVQRPSGVIQSWRSERGTVPPAENILVAQLPRIKAGEELRGTIGAEQYRDVERRLARWRPRAGATRDRPDLPNLFEMQLGWVPVALSMTFERASLLASTRNMYLHSASVRNQDRVGRAITTQGLIDRDITHWLIDGQAVLLLLADDPGPAELYRGGLPRAAAQGQCMYRVRVPLEYVGRPPEPDAEIDE